MAGIFTLLLISYILTVGLRDYGGRHFHSFTHILYTDCGTAGLSVGGIFTLSLISYILTVGLRDYGGRHFHSFTHILYIDCGTAGLRW